MLVNKIHPVEFFKDTHTYVYPLDSSVKLQSVSDFIRSYTPEVTYEQYRLLFKSDERAQEKWAMRDETSREAMDFGSRIDSLFQTVYIGEEPEKLEFTRKAYQEFFIREVQDMKARYPKMQLQVQLCNPEIGLAGTLDMCWYQDGMWYVGDLKTGREPSFQSVFGNSMLHPFHELTNSYGTKYAMQLSLYAHLLRANGNNVSNELTIFQVMKSGGIKTWKLYEISQLQGVLETRKSPF